MVQFRHLVFGLGTLPNLVRYMEVVGWTRHLSLCLYTSLEHSTGSLFSTCLFLTLSWSFTFSVIRLFSYLCSVHLCFRCVLWHIWFICMCDGLWRLWLHHWQNMLSVASVFLSFRLYYVWTWLATLSPYSSHFVTFFLCLEPYHLVWCWGS